MEELKEEKEATIMKALNAVKEVNRVNGIMKVI